MNTYGSRSTTLVKGDGAYLWDDCGKRYLDGLSGIAVCGLGHNHPQVTQAIQQQAEILLHTSNLYQIESQIALGEKLAVLANMDKVFFGNSGAEANEAAIKIARKYGCDRGVDKPIVITTNNSFHGRTLATLSATGNPKIKTGFAPLLNDFIHVPYNNMDAIIAAANDQVVAIMVEPIQGEGGIQIPDDDYLGKLRSLCDQHHWLLMLDEIQTGNGRTGKYFCYQHSDILPDVVTTAKGLGNGVPIGACLARRHAAEVFAPGNHGSTFGGNPLACSAALATVNTISAAGFLTRVTKLGHWMLATFKEKLAECPHVHDIRGRGLIIGIELNQPCSSLVESAKQQGLLINVTAGNTLRLLPPLILNDEQAETLVDIVVEIVLNFSGDDKQ